MKRVLKVSGYVLLTAYFVADLVFAAIARPLTAWMERLRILRRVNAWITGLRPYPALALFSVPVVILEPVKPVGAFLVSAGYIMEGILTIVLGEILKITLIERLFRLTRGRLMQIPIFAVLYGHWSRFHEWMTSSEIWRWMLVQKEQMKLLFNRAIASIGAARLNGAHPRRAVLISFRAPAPPKHPGRDPLCAPWLLARHGAQRREPTAIAASTVLPNKPSH
jgi:hypothetical protein